MEVWVFYRQSLRNGGGEEALVGGDEGEWICRERIVAFQSRCELDRIVGAKWVAFE